MKAYCIQNSGKPVEIMLYQSNKNGSVAMMEFLNAYINKVYFTYIYIISPCVIAIFSYSMFCYRLCYVKVSIHHLQCSG